MIDKRDIINFLFLISFPTYGLGTFIAAKYSPTAGCYASIFPHVLIIAFYCVDLLYKREFQIRLNGVYLLMLLFQLSGIVSLFIALANNLPEDNLRMTIARSLVMLVPFQSFIVVALYNDGHESALPRLTLWSLGLLLAINIIGHFALGLVNVFHNLDGQLSLPFFDGIYSGANVLAVTNLILLYYLLRSWSRPLLFTALAACFTLNLILFYMVNSRLSILTFLLVLGLLFFRAIRSRFVFFTSLFTLPILLSSGYLLYRILQEPIFVSLLHRVTLEDVTTFNGRAFLWADGINWLLYDQRGLWLGNGYKGHYFLDLIPDVVKLWNAEASHHLHLHSTALETLVCQGLLFFALFVLLFYLVFSYYRRSYAHGLAEGAFLPVVVFLLFIMQVDTFVYLDSFGFLIFSLLMSRTVIRMPMRVHTDLKTVNGLNRMNYSSTIIARPV